MNENILYISGSTPDGTPLVGGVWTLRDQEGFPLELSHLFCRDQGWAVDWAEAMADASRSNNLLALMKAVETFLPENEVTNLKLGFVRMARRGKSFDEVVAEKRANGRKLNAVARKYAQLPAEVAP